MSDHVRTAVLGRLRRVPMLAAGCALGLSAAVLLHAGSPAQGGVEEDAVRLESGRLIQRDGPDVRTGGAVRPGVSFEVGSAEDARLTGPAGLGLRFLPGASFTLTGAGPEHIALRLESGHLADASFPARLDVETEAGVVRGAGATMTIRVREHGVYAEHRAASRGRVALDTPGREATQLAPGAFRMMALEDVEAAEAGLAGEADYSVLLTGGPADGAAAPPSGSTREEMVQVAPARVEWQRVECPPDALREGERQGDCWALVSVPAQFERRVVQCQPALAPPPCPPPPCEPRPACGPCAYPMRTSGTPVPARADDFGRPPLGNALSGGPCAEGCIDVRCNRIPYVHYVEGLECDVSTYKVGCCLITVRPASRVRVHRLPDGSLQLWAPNIGKDLALIEVNENQFGFIGEDGFLVVGPDCEIQYFRGLVHLYTHPRWRGRRTPREPERPCLTPSECEPTGQPVAARAEGGR